MSNQNTIKLSDLMAKKLPQLKPLRPAEGPERNKELSPLSPLSPLANSNDRQNGANINNNLITIPAEITVFNPDGSSKSISLNDEQLAFARMLSNGMSCVLIGAAGTGKTTCTQAAISAAIQFGNVAVLSDATHKHLPTGTPGIIVTAYTRRATQNIKRQMSKDISKNTITCHKLLEYSPVFYEFIDEITGKSRRTMRFEPKRNLLNRLDQNIKTLIIDESSMLSVDLYNEIIDALGHQVQTVFIGDLNQLPPVFGHAILGYKLTELPVIELTQVYRQALESPIIRLAHRVLSGIPIIPMEFPKLNEKGKLQILPYHKRLDSEAALYETMKMFYAAYDSDSYNPNEHVILCPQTSDKNPLKRFNCTQINAFIANHIARAEKRETFEIIAGFRKMYFSIGDKCLFDKQDCFITDIRPNPEYVGTEYQASSIHLDYFGHNSVDAHIAMLNTDLDIDALINKAIGNEQEGKVLAISHIITISFPEEIDNKEVRTLGELQTLDLAYAMTIHKSQGSEWIKVFLLLHSSHNRMLNRELLYTAITRAKEQLVIVCENDSLQKGISQQAIKGNTLAEKAEFFKGKKIASKAIVDFDNSDILGDSDNDDE